MSQGIDWPAENMQSNEPTGLDIRALLWERKWLLIFFGIVGGSLGYLQFTKQPPVYQSSADVLVERDQARLPVDMATSMTAERDPIDTHIALFHTPVLLQGAVEKFQLNKLPTLAGSASPMAKISQSLGVSRSLTSDDILHFTYTSGNRSDSQQILDAVIASYLDYLGESQRSYSDKTVKLITQAKDELTDALKEKEEAYQHFRETASLLWTGEEGRNIHQQRLTQIESQRSKIMIQLSQVKAELDSMKRAIEQGVSRQALLIMADQAKQRAGDGDPASPSQRSITGQLIPLMLEEALLLETLGAKHPQVLEVRTKIDVMQKLLQKEAGEGALTGLPRPDILTVYLQSLQEELRVGNEKIKELDNLFITEKQSAKSLGAEENRNRALLEDLDRTKGLFNVVVEQLQEISLIKNNFTLSGKIVNQPSAGYEIRAQMYSYIGVGGGLGVIVGVCLAILLEFGDKRFRSPEEMMQTMQVPILGHIPEMASARNLKKLKDEQVAPVVANYHRPQSRIAEAYRLVRTSLLYDIEQNKCKIIQFTSPDPGDGKSTLCSNVGVAIANSSKRVLIIDADLRRPTQHKLFGLKRKVGLASIIQNGSELQDGIQDTPIPNLQVLTAGPRTENPSELLHSKEMESILEALRVKYDFILLDSPPVLAVSDATALSQLSDSVLLILKNSRHCKPHAKQSRVSLDLVNANVTGIVVNSVSEETSYRYEGGQYRRGLYGYNYSYGGNGYYNRAYRGYYETELTHDTPSIETSKPRFTKGS